ncbi:MAG TPA: DUF4203 domain-containing protein [Thermomicrobiales bacterium]|nr:DUF4203 domain-containing protein [Thermomicrobiales bacterium]
MNELIVGLILIVLGAVVCFYGLRFFFILLPVWGFIAGFFLGAHVITSWLGQGFLQTVSGWIVGVVLGAVFAVASYFVWYLGAIIAAASFGGVLGEGLVSLFTQNGALNWLGAVVGAIIVAIVTAVFFLPVYFVLVNTAFSGAIALTLGLMLVLQRITLGQLGNGEEFATLQAGWFWFLIALVLAVLGILWQLRSIEEVTLPEQKWISGQGMRPAGA